MLADQLADLKLGELLDTPPPGLDEAVAIAKVWKTRQLLCGLGHLGSMSISAKQVSESIGCRGAFNTPPVKDSRRHGDGVPMGPPFPWGQGLTLGYFPHYQE